MNLLKFLRQFGFLFDSSSSFHYIYLSFPHSSVPTFRSLHHFPIPSLLCFQCFLFTHPFHSVIFLSLFSNYPSIHSFLVFLLFISVFLFFYFPIPLFFLYFYSLHLASFHLSFIVLQSLSFSVHFLLSSSSFENASFLPSTRLHILINHPLIPFFFLTSTSVLFYFFI